jgi:hypothetical protein
MADHFRGRRFADTVVENGTNPQAVNLAKAYIDLADEVARLSDLARNSCGPHKVSAARASVQALRMKREVDSPAGPVTTKGPQRNPQWREHLNRLRVKLGQAPLPAVEKGEAIDAP